MSANSSPITVLSFDFGTHRIGVAVGQSVTGTATPLPVVKASDGIPNWNIIGQLVQQWQPDVFVVGMPYNMDDSESEMLLRARKFANRLNGRFHKPSFGMDERLSSFEARGIVKDSHFSGAKMGLKKDQPIDSLAAKLILESWFAQQTHSLT